MKKKTAGSRSTVEAWFEILELITPNNARGNEPVWAACRSPNGEEVWREEDRVKAEAKFASLPKGTRFRLVFISRRVILEKE